AALRSQIPQWRKEPTSGSGSAYRLHRAKPARAPVRFSTPPESLTRVPPYRLGRPIIKTRRTAPRRPATLSPILDDRKNRRGIPTSRLAWARDAKKDPAIAGRGDVREQRAPSRAAVPNSARLAQIGGHAVTAQNLYAFARLTTRAIRARTAGRGRAFRAT